MNVPVPPPPPPQAGPNLKSSIPSSNKALLSSIEKGTRLKKVPESMKNDRSSVIPGSEMAKTSSGPQQSRPINGLNSSASDQQTKQQPRGFQSIQSELANQLAMLGGGQVKKSVPSGGGAPPVRPQFRGGAPPPNQLSAAAASGARPPPPPPSSNKPQLTGPCPPSQATAPMSLPIYNRPGPPPPVVSSKPQSALHNSRAPPPPQPLNKKPTVAKVPLSESGRSLSSSVAMESVPQTRRMAPRGEGAASSSPRTSVTSPCSELGGGGGGASRVNRITGNPPPPLPSANRDSIGARLALQQHQHQQHPQHHQGNSGMARAPPVPQRVSTSVGPVRAPPPPAWGPSNAAVAVAMESAAGGHQKYAVLDRPPPPPVPGPQTQRAGMGAFDRRFCFPDERQFPRRDRMAPGPPSMMHPSGGAGSGTRESLSTGLPAGVYCNSR